MRKKEDVERSIRERTSFAALGTVAVLAVLVEIILLGYRSPGSENLDVLAGATHERVLQLPPEVLPCYLESALRLDEVEFAATSAPELGSERIAEAAAPAVSPESKMSRDLVAALERGEAGPFRVIVQVARGAQLEQGFDALEEWGRRRGYAPRSNSLSFIGATVFDLESDALYDLAELGVVTRVSLDTPVRSTGTLALATSGADQVRSGSATGSQLDGDGVAVAVIDSGVQFNQGDFGWPSDLKGKALHEKRDAMAEIATELSDRTDRPVESYGRVIQVDFTDAPPVEGDEEDPPFDGFGHGTHVAGIIAGNSANTQKKKKSTDSAYGVAPGATILSLRCIDGEGVGTTLSVLESIAFVIQNRDVLDVRVMNLSLGHPVYESYDNDPLTLACAAAAADGIAVVCSAGNTGWFEGAPAYGTVQSPGNAPWVITVGATNQKGTALRSDDTIARFSSRGPTAIDGYLKPDLVAPGTDVVSCKSNPGYLPQTYEFLEVSVADKPKYMRMSGTSMAAPMVAGTLALMFEANPSLSPNAAKAILLYTAQKMTEPDILSQGSGYLNTEGAVRLASVIRQDSDEVPEGEAWLVEGADLVLEPRSTIEGETVSWGSSFIWGQGALWYSGVNSGSGGKVWGMGVNWDDFLTWADGDPWLDPLIAYKSRLFTQGALWYSGFNSRRGSWASGVIQTDGLLYNRQAIFAAWSGALVNPDSIHPNMDGNSVLVFGEDVEATGYEFGEAGDWFYPPNPASESE